MSNPRYPEEFKIQAVNQGINDAQESTAVSQRSPHTIY
jgi:transposase-like protein